MPQIDYVLSSKQDTIFSSEKETSEASKLETLACPICDCLPNRAKLYPCCLKMSCSLCARTWLSKHSNCPFCRSEVEESMRLHGLPDANLVQAQLDELQVYCPYKDRGCEWMDKRSLLIDHLKTETPVSKSWLSKGKLGLVNHKSIPLNAFALESEWTLLNEEATTGRPATAVIIPPDSTNEMSMNRVDSMSLDSHQNPDLPTTRMGKMMHKIRRAIGARKTVILLSLPFMGLLIF